MLTADELERYARHIVLREVGGPGQAALKRARVLVVGAGGLGAPVLLYLAAAGVGTLGVIDDDAVSLSNLQRQVIHRTDDIGRPKVESAATAIRALNPNVAIDLHHARLTATMRSGSFPTTTSLPTAPTISRPVTSFPMPAISQKAAGYRGGRHL